MSAKDRALKLAYEVLGGQKATFDAAESQLIARQLQRAVEDVDKLNTRLHELFTARAYEDLVDSNQDQTLKMYREAVRRIEALIQRVTPLEPDSIIKHRELCLKVLRAITMFHPMHCESWIGWPEGSE